MPQSSSRSSPLEPTPLGQLRYRALGQQRGCGHDLSALAVAALRNFFRDPRLLKRIQSLGGESLDGGDALSRNLGD